MAQEMLFNILKSSLVTAGFTHLLSLTKGREVVDVDLLGITGEEEKPNQRMFPPGLHFRVNEIIKAMGI